MKLRKLVAFLLVLAATSICCHGRFHLPGGGNGKGRALHSRDENEKYIKTMFEEEFGLSLELIEDAIGVLANTGRMKPEEYREHTISKHFPTRKQLTRKFLVNDDGRLIHRPTGLVYALPNQYHDLVEQALDGLGGSARTILEITDYIHTQLGFYVHKGWIESMFEESSRPRPPKTPKNVPYQTPKKVRYETPYKTPKRPMNAPQRPKSVRTDRTARTVPMTGFSVPQSEPRFRGFSNTDDRSLERELEADDRTAERLCKLAENSQEHYRKMTEASQEQYRKMAEETLGPMREAILELREKASRREEARLQREQAGWYVEEEDQEEEGYVSGEEEEEEEKRHASGEDEEEERYASGEEEEEKEEESTSSAPAYEEEPTSPGITPADFANGVASMPSSARVNQDEESNKDPDFILARKLQQQQEEELQKQKDDSGEEKEDDRKPAAKPAAKPAPKHLSTPITPKSPSKPTQQVDDEQDKQTNTAKAPMTSSAPDDDSFVENYEYMADEIGGFSGTLDDEEDEDDGLLDIEKETFPCPKCGSDIAGDAGVCGARLPSGEYCRGARPAPEQPIGWGDCFGAPAFQKHQKLASGEAYRCPCCQLIYDNGEMCPLTAQDPAPNGETEATESGQDDQTGDSSTTESSETTSDDSRPTNTFTFGTTTVVTTTQPNPVSANTLTFGTTSVAQTGQATAASIFSFGSTAAATDGHTLQFLVGLESAATPIGSFNDLAIDDLIIFEGPNGWEQAMVTRITRSVLYFNTTFYDQIKSTTEVDKIRKLS